MTVTPNKTEVAPIESHTITATGCYYGRVVWKSGLNVIQDPLNTIPQINPVGAGVFQAMCVGDPSVVADWVTVRVKPNYDIIPIPYSAENEACETQTVELTGTGAPTGYTYKWYVLKDEAAKKEFRENIATFDLFETAPELFNIYETAVINVVGPGTYYVQVQNANGDKSIVRSITVAPVFTDDLRASNNSPGEIGGIVTLSTSALSSVSSYNWIGPNGFSQTGRAQQLNPFTEAMAGTYTVTFTATGGCTATATTEVTIANCDIYIESKNAANEETYKLARSQSTPGTFEPLDLNILPFTGSSTFSAYNITWMYDGNPMANAPNKPNITVDKPGKYTAVLSLKLNPSNICETEVQISSTPCNVYSDSLGCAVPSNIELPNVLANGVSIAPGDEFTAADYTVVVTEVTSGSSAGWFGKGYVEMKLINGIVAKRISIYFEDAVINECYELAGGSVITEYDPNWGGVLDVDGVVEFVEDITEELRNIYLKVYDDIEVLDCTAESKAKVNESIQALEDIKANFANSYNLSNEDALLFQQKLSEIINSLNCKTQQTCPVAGAKDSNSQIDCDFESNKSEFEELFCAIADLEVLYETNPGSSSARLSTLHNTSSVFNEDILFRAPSGVLLKWSAYNGSFSPIFGTSTGLLIPDGAVTSFYRNGVIYVGKYRKLKGIWLFEGYFKDGDSSPFIFSNAGSISNGNGELGLGLVVSENTVLPAGTSSTEIAELYSLSALVGQTTFTLEEILLEFGVEQAVKKVPWWKVGYRVALRSTAACVAFELFYTPDESQTGYGPLAVHVPSGKEYPKPIADPANYPVDAPVKLPEDCVPHFEIGTCGVYVITGPNFGEEFKTDKKGKFDIAKYGMTCNLLGGRPEKQTLHFNNEHKTEIISNTVSPGLNFSWEWVVKNISKDECHIIEKDLTAIYVLQDYRIYQKGRLPWKHKLPKFADPETILDEDTGYEELNYQKRIQRAIDWQNKRKLDCN